MERELLTRRIDQHHLGIGHLLQQAMGNVNTSPRATDDNDSDCFGGCLGHVCSFNCVETALSPGPEC